MPKGGFIGKSEANPGHTVLPGDVSGKQTSTYYFINDKVSRDDSPNNETTNGCIVGGKD